MIRLSVIGNLGKDCIINSVNGKNVINFSVAHSEKYKDSQGNAKEKTIWVDCAYWAERTGIAPYLRKGTQIFVEGIPDVRMYTKNDNSTGVSLSLRVANIQLLGNRGDNNNQVQTTSSSPQPGNSLPNASDITEPLDDLPF